MREIDRLRQQAKNKRNNVTKKFSRLRTNFGVELGGTNQDPRVPNSFIDRMTTRQLRSFIGRTDRVLDRNFGFVVGANGVLLPRNDWTRLKRKLDKFNKIAEENKAKYRDMKVPGSDRTVGQRDDEIRKGRRMREQAANRILEPMYRTPGEIASVGGMKRLERDIDKRLAPGFYEKSMRSARKQAKQMLKEIDSPELTKFVKGLDDDEFYFQWFEAKMAEDLSLKYAAARRAAVGDLGKGFANVAEDAGKVYAEEWKQAYADAKKAAEKDIRG